jgi:hypothetical protein
MSEGSRFGVIAFVLALVTHFDPFEEIELYYTFHFEL